MTSSTEHPEFEGRVALVTGGSRGIGRAICKVLAKNGADIAVNFRNDKAAAEETVEEIVSSGRRARAVRADVSDPKQVTAMIAEIENQQGPVDLLVNSAGIVQMAKHDSIPFEDWQHMMRVNIDGTFLPTMTVKDGMIERKFGRIVCLSSIAALRPRPFQIAYSTSKAAIIGFARSCSEAFAPHVRINSIAPGLIATDMGLSLGDKAIAAMEKATPLGRLGRPEEIAEMALFLLSDRSSFTTGQTFVASGGRVTLP